MRVSNAAAPAMYPSVMVQATASAPAIYTSPVPHVAAGRVDGRGGSVVVCHCHLSFYGETAAEADASWAEHRDRLLDPPTPGITPC